VASNRVEVLIGEIEKGEGALPHAHPGIEQVCYLLEGSAAVEVAGEKFTMQAGDTCFFPADAPHRFQATSEKVRVMVIYTPPYLEKPENVRR
jgi:quercetin dioxygenase-like cupin family protein